jgi:hypothetical protein
MKTDNCTINCTTGATYRVNPWYNYSGEGTGTRTQDTLIKSTFLRLSCPYI